MKVIFLDIDGVLNTNDTFEKMDVDCVESILIDEFRVEYLKKIVEKTDAKIVLSSSMRWRFRKVGNEVIAVTHHFAPEFIKLLKKYGLALYDILPIITLENGKKVLRQDEIKMWLSLNNDVENFVILDDESSFLIDFVGENFIILNRLPVGEMVRDMKDSIGLCEEHIELAINILNDKEFCKKLKKNKDYNRG